MMKELGFGLALMVSHGASAAGYSDLQMEAPHRDRAQPLHVFYPADADSGQKLQLGKNGVFIGTSVQKNASVMAGTHPVILLSHGSGGNGGNLAWIASALADQGYVVFAPNHAGTTSGDSTPQNTAKLWERTLDFTALLDQIEAGAYAKFSPDSTNVTALGFSLGGHTALALGGARVSAARYVSYCDRNVGKWDCAWMHDIDVAAFAGTQYEADLSDARIDRVIAIDPALAQAYTDDSLAAMKLPTYLLNLGDMAEVPEGVNASSIAARLPTAQLQDLPTAWHFSFLGECTRKGRFIVAAVGEDPICSEEAGGNRAALHAQIETLLTEYLSDK